MTLPFYKLQVAGSDYILLDLERAAPSKDGIPEDRLGEFSQLILDRRCGVGGRGCIYVRRTDEGLELRVFLNDGSETASGRDPLLCVGRWAVDTGRGAANSVRLLRSGREYMLRVVDSKLFSLEVPEPEAGRVALIVDGKTAAAYTMTMGETYSVAIASSDGPGPRRVRMALASMESHALPVVVRPQGTELFRFAGPEKADRLDAALVSAMAAMDQGRVGNEAVAEWRGRGGAVSYANFGDGAASGPGTLIDRGRFWVERRGRGMLRIAGMAEYAFEGNFDL